MPSIQLSQDFCEHTSYADLNKSSYTKRKVNTEQHKSYVFLFQDEVLIYLHQKKNIKCIASMVTLLNCLINNSVFVNDENKYCQSTRQD